MRTTNTLADVQLLDAELDKYSLSAKSTAKKSSTFGVALASFAIGTSVSEAAIAVVNNPLFFNSSNTTNAVVSNTNELLDIAGFGITNGVDIDVQSDDGASVDFILVATRRNSDAIVGFTANSYAYASRLNLGDTIGASAGFVGAGGTSNAYLAFNSNGTSGGEWAGGNTGFVGFSIEDGNGDFNYGWIEISVQADNFSGEVIRYAIETEVNTPIQAGAVPEPNSLACLAVGAAGLLGWRQRKKKAA